MLALATGLYVGRWGVLVVALAPLSVLAGLELSRHIAPRRYMPVPGHWRGQTPSRECAETCAGRRRRGGASA